MQHKYWNQSFQIQFESKIVYHDHSTPTKVGVMSTKYQLFVVHYK